MWFLCVYHLVLFLFFITIGLFIKPYILARNNKFISSPQSFGHVIIGISMALLLILPFIRPLKRHYRWLSLIVSLLILLIYTFRNVDKHYIKGLKGKMKKYEGAQTFVDNKNKSINWTYSSIMKQQAQLFVGYELAVFLTALVLLFAKGGKKESIITIAILPTLLFGLFPIVYHVVQITLGENRLSFDDLEHLRRIIFNRN